MTSDNKIYGYDSMPYDVRPTSAQYLDMHGDKRIYMFQRGGVIQVRRCPQDDQIAYIYVYILYIIYQYAHAPQCPAKFPIQIDRSCFGCSQNKALTVDTSADASGVHCPNAASVQHTEKKGVHCHTKRGTSPLLMCI